MTSTHFLLRVLRAVGVKDPANFHPLSRIRRLRRIITGQNNRIRDSYLSSSSTRMLHIGGGWRLLDGWLNADLALVPDVFYMDATKTFLFPADTFDFVFSEHMIEHVSFEDGENMLRECFRVMKKGGTLRLVTPDLWAVLSLYENPLNAKQQAYLDHFRKHFVPLGQPELPGVVVNTMMRTWGHTFVYDEDTLGFLLKQAGFSSILRCKLGDSAHSELRKLENENRYPPGLLDFESVALEATKK